MNSLMIEVIFLLFFITLACQHQPAVSLYRNSEQIQANITSLTKTNPFFRHESCQQDQAIKYITLGSNQPNSINAIITCNVHAHELITSQICIDLANSLSKDQRILNKISLTIIYVANNNREVVLGGEYCLRTNRNGIDPNRNFPIGFTITSGETYGGQTPLSQTYTQCLDDLAGRLRPLVYLDIHSGEFSMVFYQREGDAVSDPSEPILQQLKQFFCKHCRVVNVKDININGQAFQYMKYGKGAKYSNLLQVYGGYKAGLPSNQLCFTIFNPLSQKQLNFYRQRWQDAITKYFYLVLERQEDEDEG